MSFSLEASDIFSNSLESEISSAAATLEILSIVAFFRHVPTVRYKSYGDRHALPSPPDSNLAVFDRHADAPRVLLQSSLISPLANILYSHEQNSKRVVIAMVSGHG